MQQPHHLPPQPEVATDSVIMTNVQSNSKEVLRRMKAMAQNDAFPWNNPIDPLATNLSWPNGSRADITSAVVNVGISRTRQAALFSECAKNPARRQCEG